MRQLSLNDEWFANLHIEWGHIPQLSRSDFVTRDESGTNRREHNLVLVGDRGQAPNLQGRRVYRGGGIFIPGVIEDNRINDRSFLFYNSLGMEAAGQNFVPFVCRPDRDTLMLTATGRVIDRHYDDTNIANFCMHHTSEVPHVSDKRFRPILQVTHHHLSPPMKTVTTGHLHGPLSVCTWLWHRSTF